MNIAINSVIMNGGKQRHPLSPQGFNKSYRGAREQGKFTLFTFLFALCSLLFAPTSCDLNGSKNILGIIDQEVAWANSKPLTITVFTGDWGRSPQDGDNKCRDAKRADSLPRLGYEFNVEFFPDSKYGFEKWFAFPRADFDVWFESTRIKALTMMA